MFEFNLSFIYFFPYPIQKMFPGLSWLFCVVYLQKLWYQHVWPCLSQEMKAQEVLAAVLQPIIYLIQESSQEEYENIILPLFRCVHLVLRRAENNISTAAAIKRFLIYRAVPCVSLKAAPTPALMDAHRRAAWKIHVLCCRSVFAAPKSIQATVTLLENLHIILEKTPPEDVRTEVLPMLFNAFESSTLQVQVSATESFCSFPGCRRAAEIPCCFSSRSSQLEFQRQSAFCQWRKSPFNIY